MLGDEYSILLINDNADILDAYTLLLEQEGYHVFACSNPFGIRDWLQANWPGIILSDVCMPGCNGIDLMTLFHQGDNQLPILLITGYGDIPVTMDAVKKGAWNFLQEPIDPGKLLVLVEDALRQRESVIARRHYCQQELQVELVGYSDWVNQYRQRLRQLAETDITVWFYGGPGAGHVAGSRCLRQLGCSAERPPIRGELTSENAGQLNDLTAQAQRGILVLSHIEYLTREQQHWLVHLQSQERRPFRLINIGATSLVELTATNRIVTELYYYFTMTRIGCQSLSQRLDDIKPLFRHYLHKTYLCLDRPVPEVEVDLLEGMRRRMWLSDVRELANTAEPSAVGLLPLTKTANPQLRLPEPIPLDRQIDEYERQITTEALNAHQGRINEVTEYLQIPRKELYLRMRKYGLSKERYKLQQMACEEEERVTTFRRWH